MLLTGNVIEQDGRTSTAFSIRKCEYNRSTEVVKIRLKEARTVVLIPLFSKLLRSKLPQCFFTFLTNVPGLSGIPKQWLVKLYYGCQCLAIQNTR